MTLADQLITRISSVCALDPATLSLNTRVDDIGLDSFSLVQILTTLESELGIELRDDDVAGLLEARSIRDYLELLSRAQGCAP